MYLGKERLKEKPISLTLDEIEVLLHTTPLDRTEITTALIVLEEGNKAKEKGEFEDYLKFAAKRLCLVNEIYEIFKEAIGEKENEENDSKN